MWLPFIVASNYLNGGGWVLCSQRLLLSRFIYQQGELCPSPTNCEFHMWIDAFQRWWTVNWGIKLMALNIEGHQRESVSDAQSVCITISINKSYLVNKARGGMFKWRVFWFVSSNRQKSINLNWHRDISYKKWSIKCSSDQDIVYSNT